MTHSKQAQRERIAKKAQQQIYMYDNNYLSIPMYFKGRMSNF